MDRRVGNGGTRGTALLLVVLLVALLAVLVVEFQREARLELRSAAYLRDSLQAHAVVRAGISVGAAVLYDDMTSSNKKDDLSELWAHTGDDEVNLFIQSFVPAALEIDDLEGRFPLGALVDNGKRQSQYLQAYKSFLAALSEHLKENLEVDADILDRADHDALAEALADWMDADDAGRYETYTDAEFEVPNAPLSSLEELYRVEGYNVVPEGYGHSFAEAILPFVDIRGLHGTGKARINVNTAEAPVLTVFDPQHISYSTALSWVEELNDSPAEGTFQLSKYPSVAGANVTTSAFVAVPVSDRFRVRVLYGTEGTRHEAEAIVVRDPKNKSVETRAWREGWLRRRWEGLEDVRRELPLDSSLPLGLGTGP